MGAGEAAAGCARRGQRGLIRSGGSLREPMLAKGPGVVIHVSSIQRVLPLPDATFLYYANRQHRPALLGSFIDCTLDRASFSDA